MRTGASAIDPGRLEELEEPDVVDNQAFGFWIYLMTDLVLFAAIFATFVVLSHNYAGGPTGRDLFHLSDTFIETTLLLLSSATYGLVMLDVYQGRDVRVLAWLVVTFLLGAAFIFMEVKEFHSFIADGNGPSRSAFLSGYFTLVGTHGIHVTVGLIWMAVMMVQVGIKGLRTTVQVRLFRLSMFWHFLDIVWVGVFTVVYLRGVL